MYEAEGRAMAEAEEHELAEATHEAELADVGDLTAAPAGDDE